MSNPTPNTVNISAEELEALRKKAQQLETIEKSNVDQTKELRFPDRSARKNAIDQAKRDMGALLSVQCKKQFQEFFAYMNPSQNQFMKNFNKYHELIANIRDAIHDAFRNAPEGSWLRKHQFRFNAVNDNFLPQTGDRLNMEHVKTRNEWDDCLIVDLVYENTSTGWTFDRLAGKWINEEYSEGSNPNPEPLNIKLKFYRNQFQDTK